MELGCLEGYSGISIARGLKKNKKGRLIIIDLFEDYEYNSSKYSTVLANFKKYSVSDYVEFIKGDVFEKIDMLPDNQVDFLHIDISNNGNNVSKIFKLMKNKMRTYGLILFEGGSKERDKIEWMIKYKKRALQSFINTKYFQNDYQHFIFEPFPSLTICQRKK